MGVSGQTRNSGLSRNALVCHGSAEVPAAVVEKLADLYPEDMARGFAFGDMRGVFTLTKVLK